MIKKIFFAAILLLTGQLVRSQVRALTETGDEVILYENRTWTYVNDSVTAMHEIKVNDTDFRKSKNSTFLVKSKKLNIGIWIDPEKWNFTKNSTNEAAEFQFQKKDEDLYALMVSEKMQIPVESLKQIALQNARNAAPDARIVHEEYRNVNGIKVLMMQMIGTIQGIKFTYCGYYYSNPNGTVQLLTYTSQNLYDHYQKDIETFLNGFVEL